MPIVRCIKGHFYDGDHYGRCPYCQEEGHTETIRERKTEQVSPPIPVVTVDGRGEDVTESFESYHTPGGDVTIGHFSSDGERHFVAGWLVCTEGPERGRDYQIYKGYNRVGRSYKMDICISKDPAVSRDFHCAVIYDDRNNRFHVVEGKGTVTYRNGELLLDSEELRDGDVLQIGDSNLEFLAFCKGDKKWE